MKRNLVNRMLACALVSVMVFGAAACGNEGNEPGSDQGGYSSGENSGETDNSGSGEEASNSEETPDPTATPRPEIDMSPLSITVLATGDFTHTEGNHDTYDKLIADLNEYTQMDLHFEFMKASSYYDALDLRILAGNVPDVMLVKDNATFKKAAEEGLFWEISEYLDDYDNLSTIPEATRMNASINGKIYGIPRSRTLARNGFGYRLDWLDNLGLKEPTTIAELQDMLYQFTYGDPDGNGLDDTVGLYATSYTGSWDMMQTWFGVPNGWGIDENGDLIPAQLTDEWKTALDWFREIYSMGLVNQDFLEVDQYGLTDALTQGLAGAGNDVLDNLRKVQTRFTSDDLPYEFTLMNGIDATGEGLKILPTTGYNNMIAISTKNIKTEKELRRVLQFLNDINDGACLNLVEYGWEGKTYELDENGYVVSYNSDQLTAAGVLDTDTWNGGVNTILAQYTAPENARPVTRAPKTDPINVLEEKLYEEGLQYCVINYGAGYVSETYTSSGMQLDKMIEDARMNYITGVIDKAGLEEAIKTWLNAGMQQVIDETNAVYHAAGN